MTGGKPNALPCPICRHARYVTLLGWNPNGPRRVKVHGDVWYILCRRYSCGGDGGKNHAAGLTFLGYDREVVEQLPYCLQQQFPVHFTQKWAIEKKLYKAVRHF